MQTPYGACIGVSAPPSTDVFDELAGAGRERRYHAKLEAHDVWILVAIEIVCFIERIALY